MRHHSRLNGVRSARMLLALTLATCGGAASAQLPFFPGAEGFGGTWSGAAPAAGWLSNASVYHVTTTQDLINLSTGKPAIGTLRGAFYDYTNPNSPKQFASNRIVMFDVGGTFQLTEGSLDIKTVNNIYVAGQTAPSPVVVYGNTAQITKSNNTMTSNVILRYMTFRKGAGDGADAITFAGGSGAGDTIATNMILDHVSASWSEDEDLSVANNNTNVTVQYSIIADSLTSGHAYGSLVRPQVDANVSFHHNLYANNASRQPRLGTYNAETLTVDVRNNVVYNWRDRATYAGGSSEAEQEYVDVNYVGNYLVAGVGTISNATKAFVVDKNVDVRAFQSANFIDSDKQLNPGGVPNGSDTGWGMFQLATPVTDQTLTQMVTPFAMAPVTTQSAADAYQQVIDHVGNSWWSRDAIDSRIIGNVLGNTGPPGGIAAAAPDAAELAGVIGAPTTSHPAGYDADNDAMADAWEAKHGGNLVWNADFDNDGYINLVEFINELGEFPAPAPIVFTGGLDNRYAHIMNWKTNDGGITDGSNWQPSKYDEAQINSGAVVVDAVGQHAGVLKLGATAGSNGQLQVNSGWLEVADALVVGAHETGQGKLTLAGGSVTAQQVVVGFLGQLAGTSTLTADVTNSGAVLPGNSAGSLTIAGNYTQTSDGVLSIDLASAASFDKLTVDGDIALAGLLEVNLLGGYMPAAGATFDLLDWTGAASGAFELLALPDLNASLAWDTSLLDSQGVLSVIESPAILAGDYNDDGGVDAADYSVWRDALNSDTPLENETESLGVVDAADYDAWKMNFGATAGGTGGQASTASRGAGTEAQHWSAPEPTTLLLLAVAVSLCVTSGRCIR